MGINSFIKKANDFILNILFPTKCLGCKARSEILCNDCIYKIRPAERETPDKIIAVFDYRDLVVKRAIWELKYHHKRYIGEKLGQLLYEFLIEDISELRTYASGQPIYVVPVPISNKKIKLRGYNQANTIAKSFCESSPSKIFELRNKVVFKKIDTLPQAKITNRKKRLENVRGVFDIKNPENIKGKTIIIIDDVTTTGGTILEIMKILKQAGAKKVIGFAVAH